MPFGGKDGEEENASDLIGRAFSSISIESFSMHDSRVLLMRLSSKFKWKQHTLIYKRQNYDTYVYLM